MRRESPRGWRLGWQTKRTSRVISMSVACDLIGADCVRAVSTGCRHSLFRLPRAGLEAQGVEGDEAGGVVLVVGFFLAAFHGGDGFGVEAVRALAASVHDVALV